MDQIYVITGILVILLGLINICNKDLAWKMREWKYSMLGIKSERTANWEAFSTILGYVIIFVGMGMLYVAFTGAVR